MPISVEGSELAMVYGNVDVKAAASADQKNLKIDVDLPVLHVTVPNASQNQVQPLEDAKHIQIGAFRAPDKFVKLPMDAEDLKPPETAQSNTTVTVAIHLGNDVQVERGTDLRVAL